MATSDMASAALANAEGFKALAEAISLQAAAAQSAPPPVTRENVGTTADGRPVRIVIQDGKLPKMKVGGGNRGGAAVRARQQAQR